MGSKTSFKTCLEGQGSQTQMPSGSRIGVSKLCKRSDRKYFRLCGPHSLCRNCPALPRSVTVARKQPQSMCEQVAWYIPMPLNLWTQKFLFHVIFSWHKIFFFSFLFDHLKMEKLLSANRPYRTRR